MTIFDEYMQVKRELEQKEREEENLLNRSYELQEKLTGRVSIDIFRELDDNKTEHRQVVSETMELGGRKDELEDKIKSFFDENEEVKEVAIPAKRGGFTIISMHGEYVNCEYSDK